MSVTVQVPIFDELGNTQIIDIPSDEYEVTSTVTYGPEVQTVSDPVAPRPLPVGAPVCTLDDFNGVICHVQNMTPTGMIIAGALAFGLFALLSDSGKPERKGRR